MESRAEVQLLAGIGIPEDRYATKLGHWSDPRWPDQEVTFVEGEVLEELGLRPEDLRRNVVTRGGVLSELIGASFVVGSTQLLGVRVCDPCRYIERFSREGIFDALAGRGGLRARIIRSGLVRVGDHVGCLRANGGS